MNRAHRRVLSPSMRSVRFGNVNMDNAERIDRFLLVAGLLLTCGLAAAFAFVGR